MAEPDQTHVLQTEVIVPLSLRARSESQELLEESDDQEEDEHDKESSSAPASLRYDENRVVGTQADPEYHKEVLTRPDLLDIAVLAQAGRQSRVSTLLLIASSLPVSSSYATLRKFIALVAFVSFPLAQNKNTLRLVKNRTVLTAETWITWY